MPVKQCVLLFVICFYAFKPAAVAQKVGFDQQILLNIMKNRTEDGTRFYQGISNTTQKVGDLNSCVCTGSGIDQQ